MGKECNVSLDGENPVIVKNNTLSGKACAAFCKYLVRDDKAELLAYNVINGNDGQIKRFAVNSKNKVVALQPERIWDGGDEYCYEINSDMSLSVLEGYPYQPLWVYESHTFWFDQNDDIIRMSNSQKATTFSSEVDLPETKVGLRAAKYDGKTLQNKWVVNFEDTGELTACRVDAKHGLFYIISSTEADYDPTEETYIVNEDQVLARYIETYRVKTSSENASVTVNEGKDMVRHGEDAEIVAKAKSGYHIEKITTSKGDNVEFSWDGHCTLKNVTEPIELIITTAEGEASVYEQSSAVSVVYPNPFNDVINVKEADDAFYEIFDMAGRLVDSGSVKGGRIATEKISGGIYTLTINKEVGAYSVRVVKE